MNAGILDSNEFAVEVLEIQVFAILVQLYSQPYAYRLNVLHQSNDVPLGGI